MTFLLQKGWSPSYVASFKGHLDILKTLIEAGANIYLTDKVCDINIFLVHSTYHTICAWNLHTCTLPSYFKANKSNRSCKPTTVFVVTNHCYIKGDTCTMHQSQYVFTSTFLSIRLWVSLPFVHVLSSLICSPSVAHK